MIFWNTVKYPRSSAVLHSVRSNIHTIYNHNMVSLIRLDLFLVGVITRIWTYQHLYYEDLYYYKSFCLSGTDSGVCNIGKLQTDFFITTGWKWQTGYWIYQYKYNVVIEIRKPWRNIIILLVLFTLEVKF